jgi:hypothetical protein
MVVFRMCSQTIYCNVALTLRREKNSITPRDDGGQAMIPYEKLEFIKELGEEYWFFFCKHTHLKIKALDNLVLFTCVNIGISKLQ